MSNKAKYFWIILFAQYVFFRFYFNFVSTSIQQLVFFGFLGVYIVSHREEMLSYFKHMGEFKTFFIVINLIYMSVVTAAFFVPLLYKTYDFSYFYTHLRYLSYLVSYVVLLDMIKRHLKPHNLKDKFLHIFIVSSRNYVIVTLVMLVIPQIKSFWQLVVLESPRNLELINTNPSYVGRFGWAGYSGFSITFLCSIAVLGCLYFIIKETRQGKKVSLNYILSLILLVIGNSFYGRAGLLNSLAMIGLAVLYIIVKSKKFHYAFGLVAVIALLFALLTVLKETNETMASWYSWMMDPIINIVTTGSFNTTSTDHLFSMYFIPELPTLLLGDGFYTSPTGSSYYMSVDVGYLRPTLFYGIFMLVLSYAVPVLLSIGIYRNGKQNRVLSMMVILTLFIFEVKGEVYIPLTVILYVLFLAEMKVKEHAPYQPSNGLSSRRANFPKNRQAVSFAEKG